MPECKHEDISRELAEELARHVYTDQFPPVRELAARYHVSTRTMNKALKPLVKQGLIIPDGPRGCRVAPRNAVRSRKGMVSIFAGIGKIVPDEDPLIAPLLDFIRADNCTPLLTDMPRTEMIRDTEFWRSTYMDGYIFVYSSFNIQLARLLRGEGIPFVAANRLPESYGGQWVDFDHYPAMLEMTRILLRQGSRRIALLDKPSFSNSIEYSQEMWGRIMDELEVPPEMRCPVLGAPVEGEEYINSLWTQLKAMLAAHTLPDTIIVRNRLAGTMLQELLQESSDRIRLVRISDTLLHQLPYKKLALALWELFKRIRDNAAQPMEHYLVPFSLNLTESGLEELR